MSPVCLFIWVLWILRFICRTHAQNIYDLADVCTDGRSCDKLQCIWKDAGLYKANQMNSICNITHITFDRMQSSVLDGAHLSYLRVLTFGESAFDEYRLSPCSHIQGFTHEVMVNQAGEHSYAVTCSGFIENTSDVNTMRTSTSAPKRHTSMAMSKMSAVFTTFSSTMPTTTTTSAPKRHTSVTMSKMSTVSTTFSATVLATTTSAPKRHTCMRRSKRSTSTMFTTFKVTRNKISAETRSDNHLTLANTTTEMMKEVVLTVASFGGISLAALIGTLITVLYRTRASIYNRFTAQTAHIVDRLAPTAPTPAAEEEHQTSSSSLASPLASPSAPIVTKFYH